jgi:hypothetical protein
MSLSPQSYGNWRGRDARTRRKNLSQNPAQKCGGANAPVERL